ncbi:MAG: L-lactate permease [Caldimicrobium sp.]|nr:L-lactate permease [Caldimicrobium sp.]
MENPFLSALIASLPIGFLFWALAIKRIKGWWASIGGLLITFFVALVFYEMPLDKAFASFVFGFTFGLWPLSWIIFSALFLYNLTQTTGDFDIIRYSLLSISQDKRILAILIAFCFGAFLEGASGFGTPVAITTAILTGLGFHPVQSASIALIANTTSVAFGAVGIPIVVGAQVSELDLMTLSKMVGRQLFPFCFLIPFYITFLLSGLRRTLEILPFILISGGTFAITTLLVSNLVGPYLPGILAAMCSLFVSLIFLKFWQPKEILPAKTLKGCENFEINKGFYKLFRAWLPFILVSFFIGVWGIKEVKEVLDNLLSFKIFIPKLHREIVDYSGRYKEVYLNLNLLSSAGTALFIASILYALALRVSFSMFFKIAWQTFKNLKLTFLNIGIILGFAYMMNFSGMAITLGLALASTGYLFPFFSAFIGWLGVFITGSDTSSNALFGKLQEVSAKRLNIEPLLCVATNTTGGVMGKMISPQSIAVATVSSGLSGREGELFRLTFKHSLFLTTLVGLFSLMQSYWLTFMIPASSMESSFVRDVQDEKNFSGYLYLSSTLFLAGITVFIVRLKEAGSSIDREN